MQKLLWTIVLFFFVPLAFANESSPVSYDDHGKRDPFWPLITPSGAIINYEKDLLLSDMVLEGIISGDDGENFAIINGLIVKVHDTIGLFVIEDIGIDRVTLIRDQSRFVLKLIKED